MKRRKFTQAVLTAMSISTVPIGVSFAAQSTVRTLQTNESITTKDGLKLNLNHRQYPMKDKDEKQFIITYDVENNNALLKEKIYQFKVANGETHQLFMTPVNDNQLQAVFNWRLNA